MKPLKDIFPRASASFLAANRQAFLDIAAHLETIDAKSRGNVCRIALRSHDGRQMNATERAYALVLEAQRNAGEIVSWRYESVKLRLGDGCWYVPDFFIERAHLKPLIVEVKGGFIREDARVKFIAAKEIHRWAAFEMWQKKGASWTRLP